MNLPLYCNSCNSSVIIKEQNASCKCKNNFYELSDGIYISANLAVTQEAVIRDRQAKGYLQHSKFPCQLNNFSKWINSLPIPKQGEIALDLGCGPEMSGYVRTEDW